MPSSWPPAAARPSHSNFIITRTRKGFRGHNERPEINTSYDNQIPLRDFVCCQLGSSKSCLFFSNKQQIDRLKLNDCYTHLDSSIHMYSTNYGLCIRELKLLYKQLNDENESNEMNNAVKASAGAVAAGNASIHIKAGEVVNEAEVAVMTERRTKDAYDLDVNNCDDRLKSLECTRVVILCLLCQFGFFGHKYVKCPLKWGEGHCMEEMIIKYECTLNLKKGLANSLHRHGEGKFCAN